MESGTKSLTQKLDEESGTAGREEVSAVSLVLAKGPKFDGVAGNDDARFCCAGLVNGHE